MMMHGPSNVKYPELSDCRNKEILLTDEAAALLKLVLMLIEPAGVRFLAGRGRAFFSTTVCRPILGPTLPQLLITSDKANAG